MGGRQHIVRRLASVGAKFLAVGALSTIIEIAVFNILVFVFGLDTIPAKLLASLVALVNAYIGNRRWAFRDRGGDRLPQLGRFLVVNIVCAVLGATLLAALIAVLTYQIGLEGALWLNISNVVSIGVVVVVRFALYHFWAFRDRAADPAEPAADALESTRRGWSRRTVLVVIVCVLAFAYTLAVAPYNGFVDEYDNILGGWLLLNRGELPYTGFFSHHMPLAYFLAVPIVAMVGSDLVLFRIGLAIVLFSWLLLINRTATRSLGTVPGLVIVVGMTALTLSTMTSALLAETLVAYATVHAVIVLAGRLQLRQTSPTIRDAAVIAVVGAIPALSSLSYAVLSLVLYGWFVVLVLRDAFRRDEPARARIARLIPFAGWLVGPWLAFAAYLGITLSAVRFIEQAYTFNVTYYSQFVGDVADGIGATLVANVTSFFASLIDALAGGPTLAETLAQILAMGMILLFVALALVRAGSLIPPLLLLIVFGSYRNWAVARAFGDISARYMVYFALIVVIATVVIAIARSRRAQPHVPVRQRRALAAGLLVGVLVLAVPLAGAARSTVGLARSILAGTSGTIQSVSANPAVPIANAVLTTRDHYFIGPFDFASQMYLHGSRTSIYTFVLPWHGACDPCMAELADDFEREPPLVIMWEARYTLWGNAAVDYASEVQNLLDSSYFQIDAPGAEDVYFRTSERELVEGRLDEAGIPSTPRD